MNTRHERYRIAINANSEHELRSLERAFRGQVEHGEHVEASDDFLIAVVLGWHMRDIHEEFLHFAKAIAWEFSMRQSFADSPHFDDERVARRRAARGTPSTPGNILTIDGIDNRTYSRIEVRIHALKAMIKKLTEVYESRDYEALDKTLARYSDQAIIDLSLWTVLSLSPSTSDEIEPFPREYKDEILARGQARLEWENGTLTDDAAPGQDASSQRLSAREQRAFLLRRRIKPGTEFWTEERIRAALEMGL